MLLFEKAARGLDEDLRLQFVDVSRFNDDEKGSSEACSKVFCDPRRSQLAGGGKRLAVKKER
jgi:hypothetical protein